MNKQQQNHRLERTAASANEELDYILLVPVIVKVRNATKIRNRYN